MTETKKLLGLITKNSYTHLIFDMDETLSRLKLPWKEGYETLCALAPDDLGLLMRRKRGEKQSYSYIVNPAVETDESFLPLAIDWAQQFEKQLAEHEPNLELVGLIPELAEKYTLYVWSSNTQASVKKVLKDLGIEQYFAKIIAREDVKLLKPAPDGWRHVSDHAPKEKFLFIGDSYNDREAASAIGIDYFEIAHFKNK